MPENFPEVWVDRVETNLTDSADAPWLAGIPEIASPINEVNPGAGASEQNEIHLPVTEFEVDILINNTTYPIPVQVYEDGTITIRLDKYQTKRVPLTDDQVIGCAYDIIDAVTRIMSTNITEEKYAKAIHSIAPAANTADTPVLVATGRSGKYSNGQEIIWVDEEGNLMLTYKDIADLKTKIDKLPKGKKWPKKGRRLVLCGLHEGHLMYDRERFADLLNDLQSGEVRPMIAGFEIFSHPEMPHFNGTTKLAYNAVPSDDQLEASVAFHVQGIAIKTGLTKQYYSPSNTDTGNQQNEVAYRHYYICTPKRARYIAAMTTAKAPEQA